MKCSPSIWHLLSKFQIDCEDLYFIVAFLEHMSFNESFAFTRKWVLKDNSKYFMKGNKSNWPSSVNSEGLEINLLIQKV